MIGSSDSWFFGLGCSPTQSALLPFTAQDFINDNVFITYPRSLWILPLQVMEQLSEGGGAQTITIDTVGEEVEELAKKYPICIPAYFGLIIRCFGTLEVRTYCILCIIMIPLHEGLRVGMGMNAGGKEGGGRLDLTDVAYRGS